MELKATSLLLLMCVTIIITSAGTNAIIPSCCVTVSKKLPRDMLRAVSRYEIQTRSGACEIDALILHFRNKKICAHPRLMKVLKSLKKNHKRKRP